MTRNKKNIAIFPLILLLILGGLNIYKKARWKEWTDGVVWQEKPQGLTAIKVETGSPAYLAGIKKGDILYKINDTSVKNRIDVIKNIWYFGTIERKVIYQIGRPGELLPPSFYLTKKGVNFIYFYLALVGLITLTVGFIVFVRSKLPFSMPYIFFYILSIVLYSSFTFSATGELNFLDSLFYWLDKLAFLFFPPLLFHFFMIFPQRKKFFKKNPRALLSIYFPAGFLLLAKILVHFPHFWILNDRELLFYYGLLERADLFQFSFFTIGTLIIIFLSSLKATSLLIRQQLKWIVLGLGFGTVPFTFFYVLPFMMGLVPSQLSELTILLQALIPLTFAYSISRHKLMDFEVLLKKAFTLIFSYFVITSVYFVVSSQTRIFAEYKLNALILGILAIILGATLFTPLKALFQSLLDRAFYKRSYKYRKTLLVISKELSRERNLQNLSRSLLELIANAFSLRSIALLLPLDKDDHSFKVFRFQGEFPPLPEQIAFPPLFFDHLREADSISFYPYSEEREFQNQWREFTVLGFFHFLPLKVEGKLVGCLAMGKKVDNSFLNSEDWELLTTISPSLSLALENAYLYEQANLRARELERLKDYSENIIESLTVGVAVLDEHGMIIGWNRVLEEMFGTSKEKAIGKKLMDVLGKKNFAALFPSHTHQDYRLLNEVPMDIPSGEKRIFDIAKTPLLDNKLIPYGTVVVFEDITEKIRLQQQLMTSEKLASIGLLSAGVAHEINTPLTGISSYVQLLQKKLQDTHYAQILEKIETQAERVAKIIKNLLNFARNPSDSSFYKLDLKENLQEIISLLDYKLKTMNINLELNLTTLKPIWAQGERLQQVFLNIILNAIDAMPKGGMLKIELFEKEKKAVVKISDTGTGIKPEHLPHIFDPFFTTKGLGKGTGLGLSISYAIIKEHEGDILVESEVGKGTCFTIVFPIDVGKRKVTEKILVSGK